MPNNKQNKAKLFDPKLFPMDLGRLFFWFFPVVCRFKKLTPTGEKYRGKIKGGAVIAANHNGFSDPVLLCAIFWYRRLFFLVGEVVMKGRLRRTLIRGMGGIKIERGIADVEAMKKAVGVLKEGHVLGLFPQGGITKAGEIETIKSGAVLMALQAGVPIVPLHIYPQGRWYQRRKVVIGDPIYPNEICKKKIPSTADIQKITDVLMAEMNRCIVPDGVQSNHMEEKV